MGRNEGSLREERGQRPTRLAGKAEEGPHIKGCRQLLEAAKGQEADSREEPCPTDFCLPEHGIGVCCLQPLGGCGLWHSHRNAQAWPSGVCSPGSGSAGCLEGRHSVWGVRGLWALVGPRHEVIQAHVINSGKYRGEKNIKNLHKRFIIGLPGNRCKWLIYFYPTRGGKR